MPLAGRPDSRKPAFFFMIAPLFAKWRRPNKDSAVWKTEWIN